jgi:pimeloyl-ACP methyl ester carboxylesterase
MTVTLVLVHGITESKASWDPLVEALSAIAPVVAVDLKGHGDGSTEPPFDLGSLAMDVIAEVSGAGVELADTVLIGHSLGGTVVSAMAANAPCRGVVNVDQPLALAAFQSGLQQLEPLLRGDEASFRQAITMVFDTMRGPLSEAETARIEGLRRPVQAVVLDVWDPVLTQSAADLDALVAQIAASINVPYLSLHGIDPGEGYADWLAGLIPTATVEVWADHGHYPHLVDPDAFVARVAAFVNAL